MINHKDRTDLHRISPPWPPARAATPAVSALLAATGAVIGSIGRSANLLTIAPPDS
jgi:hypothetical protein